MTEQPRLHLTRGAERELALERDIEKSYEPGADLPTVSAGPANVAKTEDGKWEVQPDGSVVFAAAPEEGPPCARCGVPLPPLPKELAAAARANPGATFTHDVCPGLEPPAPTGRYFEVRVDIVEVKEVPSGFDGTSPEVIELVSFKHGETGENLDSVMRSLAAGLGEKWMAAEKQAAVADSE